MSSVRLRSCTVCAALALTLAAAAFGLAAPAESARPHAEASARSGHSLWVSYCGSCHVLRAAHTHGKAGPNLDRLFRRVKKSRVKRIVRAAIIRGKEGMPRGILRGANVDRVAAYVAKLTGRR